MLMEAFKSLAPGIASSPVLPMFKPKPCAKPATQVGNYAIQITFTDGHSTGSYAYECLRSICPCEMRQSFSHHLRRLNLSAFL